jgi:hypothetical protein
VRETSALAGLNLTLRFACELAALAGVAWFGWGVSPVLGAVFPLVVAVVWGLWIAPKARRRLPDPARFVVELVVFAVATAAFSSVGQPVVAAGFAVAAVVTAALVRVWPEPVA